MDVSYLSQNYQKLLDYLKEHGYGYDHSHNIKRAIRATLSDGANPKIQSYQQLFLYEIKKMGLKSVFRQKAFRTALCCVKQFDQEGKYPNWTKQTRLDDKPSKYDLLYPEFICLIDDYVTWASTTSKREKTIKDEKNAAVNFFYHFQERGITMLHSVKRNDVLSFFFNGEKHIRGKAYIGKIMPILKYAALNHNTDVVKIIEYIPKIPKTFPNYDFLKKDECSKIVDVLSKEKTKSKLLDKTIVTIAYYTGMRGTDISSLSINNIDWENDTIRIAQSKTGEELTLPLTTAVGNAIWTYITSQRPNCNSKEILLSNRHPHKPLKCLYYNIKKILYEAGVRTDGSRTGIRIFRHHLATTLLANEVPSPIISSILGHVSSESLNPYVDADIEHLRECALDIDEYMISEEVFEL